MKTKLLLALALTLALGLKLFAAASVTVGNTSHLIQFPPDFVPANDIAKSSTVYAATVRIGALEGQTNTWATEAHSVQESNRAINAEAGLSTQITTETNRAQVAESGINTIATNAATIAQLAGSAPPVKDPATP